MARNNSVSVITEWQDFVTEPQEPDCTEDSPQELSFDVAPQSYQPIKQNF